MVILTEEQKKKKKQLLEDANLTQRDPFDRNDSISNKGRRLPSNRGASNDTANKESIEQSKKESAANNTELVKDADTGRLTGIRLPDGRTLLGLSPNEARGLYERSRLETGEDLPPSTLFAEQQGRARAEQRAAGDLLRNQGFVDFSNRPSLLTENDREKQIRENFGLVGTPINIVLRRLKARGATSTALATMFGFSSSWGDPSPEAMREVLKVEINGKVYEKHLTATEDMASLIEALPFAAPATGQFIETPLESARAIDTILSNERERAINIASGISAGVVDPEQGIQMIDEIINYTDEAEARLTLMIYNSATLQANPSDIEKIQSDLFRSRDRLVMARTIAQKGVLSPGDDAFLLNYLESLRTQESEARKDIQDLGK